MSSPNPNHLIHQNQVDSATDLSARLSGLGIDDGYSSPMQQQHPHQHSPHNAYGGGMSLHTPVQPRMGFAYDTQNQGPQYGYYPSHEGTPYSAGVPPANYPYGGPPPDILSPMTTGAPYETYAPAGDIYAPPQRESLGHTHPQGGWNAQPRSYRPPHLQQAASRAQQGYYGYQDQRQGYWNYPSQMYIGGADERKKDIQVGPSHAPAGKLRLSFCIADPYPHQNNNPMQSPLLPHTPLQRQNQHAYQDSISSDAMSPHGNYSLSSPATPGFVNAGSYGMHGYAPSTPAYSALSVSGHHGFHGRTRRYDENDVVRSQILEEFRMNKQRRWELREIFGHIVEFSGDQHGSRFIQQKLETASNEDRQQLFDEIMPNAYQLMTDVFGNYVTQKMFEHGDQMQKANLAKKMEGHVLDLSMQMYGCRVSPFYAKMGQLDERHEQVVQKAMEHVLVAQRAVLIKELEPHVLECVKSSNANHVIQRLITLGPPESISNAFLGHVFDLASHPYGCRVLQKSFENLPEDTKRPLLDEMHEHIDLLMEDQFGNYVVQSVIQSGTEQDRDLVIEKLKGKMLSLSRHKFASNVCEKALQHASPEARQLMIAELIDLKPDGSNMVGTLLRDAYGNFPLQVCLSTAEAAQRAQLLSLIMPILPQIRHTPVGKRLETKIAQYEQEGYLQQSFSSSDSNASGFTPSSNPGTAVTSPERKTSAQNREEDRKLETLLH
ncbi:pumilio RNA-binding family, partial [Tremellales sp. Uapishka_1]